MNGGDRETVKTDREKMSLWASGQLQTESGEDAAPMKDFQKELQPAWYAVADSGREFIHSLSGILSEEPTPCWGFRLCNR
jgi:hypothetical protein